MEVCLKANRLTACTSLDRQENLDSHILSLMHEFSLDEHLMYPDSVMLLIRWVGSSGDLDLAPFAVRGHKLAFCCAVPKFLVDALLLDAALSLDKR